MQTEKKHPPNTAPDAMSTLSKTLLMSLLLGGMPYLFAGQNATAVYGVTGTGSFHKSDVHL
jgi:hypothetical protein